MGAVKNLVACFASPLSQNRNVYGRIFMFMPKCLRKTPEIMKFNRIVCVSASGKFAFFISSLLLVLFFTVTDSYAIMQRGTSNPDITFNRARDLARNQLYAQARDLCDEILRSHPDYHDASILKARTYSWEGNYDQARVILKAVREKVPGNRDALYALIDVEMWSGNYEQAIRYLDLALQGQPNNTHLLYRKALALKESGDETASVVIINQILDIDPTYTEAKDLLKTIETSRYLNHIGLGYRGYYFLESDGDPWHLFYGEFGRRTRVFGPTALRANFANRYGINDWQVELDAYPTVRPGTYLYLNVGFAPNSELFPYTRFGFELFQALPASWEASAGFRLLNFENKDLLILTGSLSKYFSKYYISFRPYFSFSSDGSDPNSQSYFLTFRRFFSNSDHYLNLMIGRGSSADFDRLFGGEVYDLGGTLFEAMLTYQHSFSQRFLLKGGVGYKFYDSDVLWGNPTIFEGRMIYRF
jgi:YaiO family outer membrane protein